MEVTKNRRLIQSRVGKDTVTGRAIKYYQSLSQLLTWWLRFPMSEQQLTQAFKLRDFEEEQLDYLISVQSEELIYA